MPTKPRLGRMQLNRRYGKDVHRFLLMCTISPALLCHGACESWLNCNHGYAFFQSCRDARKVPTHVSSRVHLLQDIFKVTWTKTMLNNVRPDITWGFYLHLSVIFLEWAHHVNTRKTELQHKQRKPKDRMYSGSTIGTSARLNCNKSTKTANGEPTASAKSEAMAASLTSTMMTMIGTACFRLWFQFYCRDNINGRKEAHSNAWIGAGMVRFSPKLPLWCRMAQRPAFGAVSHNWRSCFTTE